MNAIINDWLIICLYLLFSEDTAIIIFSFNCIIIQGFRQGWSGPLAHHQRGNTPVSRRNEKNIPYLAVISVKIGYSKQSNLKLQYF